MTYALEARGTRRWMERGAALLACAVLGASLPSIAHAAPSASEKAIAESDFEEARQLMTAGKPAEACPKFEESERLDPGMATEYRLGECYEAIGRTASAWIAFIDVADAADAAKMPDRSKVARERAAKLQPKLARIAISPTTPELADLRVVRDGEEIKRSLWGTPVPVDPGDHNIEVTAPGKKPWRATVKADPSATQTVTVPALEDLGAATTTTTATTATTATTTSTTAPPPAGSSEPFDKPRPEVDAVPSSKSSQKTYAIIAAAVGVVGIGVGGVLALSAKSQWGDTAGHCNDAGVCDPTGIDARSNARSKGNLATVVMGLGVVAVAAGAVLWFTAPEEPEHKTANAVRVGVTPWGAVLEGHF